MKVFSRSAVTTAALSISILMTSAAAASDALSVRLDWTPWGVHAPFHLAAEKGLFELYGLDVTLEDGNGSVATVQIVGNGDFDLGHASLAPMMIARSKGLPVKAVANFVRQNDIGLLVPRDGGIAGPGDLAGMTLAYTAGSLETPFLDSFLAAGGLEREAVSLVNVDAAAKAGTYMAGRADGAFSSVPFFLAVVEENRPSTAVRFADHGLQFPSFGLFATEAKLEEKGEAIARFASVVAGTWAYIAAGNQDEAVEAIMAARPQARLSPTVLREQIDTLLTFFETEATAGSPPGTMALADWEVTTETLLSGGLLDGTPSPADFFVEDLLDEAVIEEIASGRF